MKCPECAKKLPLKLLKSKSFPCPSCKTKLVFKNDLFISIAVTILLPLTFPFLGEIGNFYYQLMVILIFGIAIYIVAFSIFLKIDKDKDKDKDKDIANGK